MRGKNRRKTTFGLPTSDEPEEEGKGMMQPEAAAARARSAQGIAFRPIRPEDAGFLYEVYASTRQDEMAVLPWEPSQKEAFLRMQFKAQHEYYQEHYPGDSFQVILLDGRPIGRLYLGRWEQEFRVIDIALLPAYRNRGIGSALMHDILKEAGQAGKPVRIHVEKTNPALRLYGRLGFSKIEDKGVYDLMEWRGKA